MTTEQSARSEAPDDDGKWAAGPRALALHRDAIVFDSLSLDYVLDERYTERLLAGGITATNVTFAVEEDWDDAMKLIETSLQKVERSPLMILALEAEDVRRAKAAGRLAIIMGTQGASMIANEFARVRTLYRLGLRCIQLTYTSANLYGDGCGEPRDAGLTLQGREFIDAVNELAMWLDLSHCGHHTTTEAIDRARRPVITHANSYAVHPSDRNKKDETVRAVVAKGGMIGVAMPPRFITSRPGPSLGDLLDHVDHFVSLVGYEHVGTGFDFTEKLVETKSDLPAAVRWRRLRPDIFGSVDEFAQRRNPTGIQSIRQAPNFTQGLIDRGYVDEQVLAIIGGNWLRTFGTLAARHSQTTTATLRG